LEKDAIMSLLQQKKEMSKEMSKEHGGLIQEIVYLPLICYVGTTTVYSITTLFPNLKSFFGMLQAD